MSRAERVVKVNIFGMGHTGKSSADTMPKLSRPRKRSRFYFDLLIFFV
jgi:hypothetical protein